MRRTWIIGVLLSLVLACQGCATVAHWGTEQDVHINTDPPGARAYAGGRSIIPFLSEQVRRETRNTQSPTVAGKFDPALSIER